MRTPTRLGPQERTTPLESDYSKNHQANIAMNKELLASLGLGEGVGILGESSSKKEKNKK